MAEHLQGSDTFWRALAQRLAEGAREAEDTGDHRTLYSALADYDKNAGVCSGCGECQRGTVGEPLTCRLYGAAARFIDHAGRSA